MLVHLCYTWFSFSSDVLFSADAIVFCWFFFHFFGDLMLILDISVYPNAIPSTYDAPPPSILSPFAFLQPGWFVHVRRETALNHVCSLWQCCLWIVFIHGLTWGCSDCKKINKEKEKKNKKKIKSQKSVGKKATSVESVLPRAHSVIRMRPPTSIFHWLKGPKCKLTQITEVFALIKHSVRAFKESTLCHWSFAPWATDLYIPSFAIKFDPLRLQIHLHHHTFGILQSQIFTILHLHFFLSLYFFFLTRDVT